MRLLICAGGTGGGIFPALAVLQALNELKPSWRSDGDLLWVGGEKGMEAEIVSRQNIDFKSIPAAGVHGVGLKNLPGNLSQLMRGYIKARQIIRNFRPDVLFFTGGYLSVPVAYAGRAVPSLVFLPDIEPGLAIKTISNLASSVALSVDQSLVYVPRGKDVIISGYPVRLDIQNWTRDKALSFFNLSSNLPILLVFGGSKGARSINRGMKAIIEELLDEIQIIHICGNLDWEEMKDHLDSLSVDHKQNYRLYPFLHDEMGAAYRCADLVVSRSGASILGEYPIFELPAILVPYPHAWRYQKVNAKYLEDRGAAIIMDDERLLDQLLPTIQDLIKDQSKLDEMKAAVKNVAQPKAAVMIAEQLFSLGENAKGGKLL